MSFGTKKILQEKTSEWGGELEILAIGEMLEVQINIEGHINPICENHQIKIVLFYENGNHYEFGILGENDFWQSFR